MIMLTTEAIPSAKSTGAPYIAGNFAPLRSEVTAFDLEVIGHIPEELSGRFLRIGPNPIDELDQVRLVRHHWFAGSGMAHGLRLRDGKADWFRSRFVLDREAARVLSRKPLSGPGEGARDGSVNTNLMNQRQWGSSTELFWPPPGHSDVSVEPLVRCSGAGRRDGPRRPASPDDDRSPPPYFDAGLPPVPIL
jgi:carotenoid cleavage dioxygenase-like enzyme